MIIGNLWLFYLLVLRVFSNSEIHDGLLPLKTKYYYNTFCISFGKSVISVRLMIVASKHASALYGSHGTTVAPMFI